MVKPTPSRKREFLPLPYPQNLIITLADGLIDTFEVTEDIQAGLDFALSTLTDVEREVLKLRYEDRLTYAQIGAVRERSKNGARDTETNAFRKLRRPPMIGYILYGKKGFEEKDYIFHWPWQDPPPKPEPPSSDVLKIPFEELDFSIRSFNNLRRAGYEFVGDIVNLTYEEIQAIPYLPPKNCNEIAWKLWHLGLKNTCWKYFQH